MTPYYEDSRSGVTIYNGDCKEVLPSITKKFDLTLTDPPFSENTHNNAKSNRNLGYGNKAIDFKAIDFKELRSVLQMCGNLTKRWVIAFMDWRHIARIEQDIS